MSLARRDRQDMLSMLTCFVCKGLVRPKVMECASCERLLCGPCAKTYAETGKALPCCLRKKTKPVNRKLRALVLDRLKIWHECPQKDTKGVLSFEEYHECLQKNCLKNYSCPHEGLLTPM